MDTKHSSSQTNVFEGEATASIHVEGERERETEREKETEKERATERTTESSTGRYCLLIFIHTPSLHPPHLYPRLKNIGSRMDDIEDHYYRLRDRHLQLKREADEARNQVKVLTTKVARLLQDKKRMAAKELISAREVEMEEVIFDMSSHLDNLQKQNDRLRDQSVLLQSQLPIKRSASFAKNRPTSSMFHKRSTSLTNLHINTSAKSWANVPSRVDSGLKRKTSTALTKYKSHSCLSVNRSPHQHISPHFPLPRSALKPSLSVRPKESRVHISNDPKIKENNVTKMPLDTYDEIARQLLTEARDEIQSLQEVVAEQQTVIQDQRENHISTQSSQSLRPSTSRGDKDRKIQQSDAYLETLRKQLKEEQDKNQVLKNQLSTERASHQKLQLLQKRIEQLEEENNILQESLEKCTNSCFNHIKVTSSVTGRQVTTEATLSQRTRGLIDNLQKQLHFSQSRLEVVDSQRRSLEQQLHQESTLNIQLSEENERLKSQLEQLILSVTTTSSPTVVGQTQEQLQQQMLKNQEEEYHSLHPSFPSSSTAQSSSQDQLQNQTMMKNRMIQMQQERDQVLRQFSQMKIMLEQLQDSMKESEREDQDEDDDQEDEEEEEQEQEQEVYESDFEPTTSGASSSSTRDHKRVTRV